MKTNMLTKIATLALAGSMVAGAAFAAGGAQGPCPYAAGAAGPAGVQGGWRMDPARVQQRMEMRMERLHTVLQLKADQAAAWDVFHGVVTRSAERSMGAALKMRSEARPDSAVDRLKLKEDALRIHLAELESVRKAAQDFYATLAPEQRKVFDQEFTLMHGPRGGGAPGRPGPGFGGMGPQS